MAEIRTFDPRFPIVRRHQKTGNNASTIVQDNRRLVLSLIRERGRISRKELAELTGLKQATITIIVQELMQKGFVSDSGMVDGKNGRRMKGLSMSWEAYIIAVRYAEGYVKIAMFDMHLQIVYIRKKYCSTDDPVTEGIAKTMESIRECERIVEREQILGIVVGVEHLYELIDNDYAVWDNKNRRYRFPGKELYDQLGYRVFSNRSVNLAAHYIWETLGKDRRDAGGEDQEYAMACYIQISYDVESSIIVNRENLYGASGHCGDLRNVQLGVLDRRTINEVASISAILQRARELLPSYPGSILEEREELNIRDVIAGYDKMDPLCRFVYDEMAEYLGAVIANIVNWLDPDLVVPFDELPSSDEYLAKLRNEASRYITREQSERIVFIRAARSSSNDPVLHGGARYGFDLILENLETV